MALDSRPGLTSSACLTTLASAYPTGADVTTNASRYLDVPTQLLETALAKKPTALAGVPWVLQGFMKAWKNESDAMRRVRIMEAIKLSNVFGPGAEPSLIHEQGRDADGKIIFPS